MSGNVLRTLKHIWTNALDKRLTKTLWNKFHLKRENWKTDHFVLKLFFKRLSPTKRGHFFMNRNLTFDHHFKKQFNIERKYLKQKIVNPHIQGHSSFTSKGIFRLGCLNIRKCRYSKKISTTFWKTVNFLFNC